MPVFGGSQLRLAPAAACGEKQCRIKVSPGRGAATKLQ